MKTADTHIHLTDFDQINLIADINFAPSIELKDWEQIEEAHLKHKKRIVPAFGIHPWAIKKAPDNWFSELKNLLQKHPNAIIGETGLDRLKDKNYSPQNDFFKKHLELAIKYNRPIIIHAVKADMWLEEYWTTLSKTTFVIHSFNGRSELLQKIIKAGGYVSFSGSIFKNKDKEKILRQTPLDKMLIETDGPYQKTTLLDVARGISEIIKIDYEEFLRIVYDNSIRFLARL